MIFNYYQTARYQKKFNPGDLMFIAIKNESIISEKWLPSKIRSAFTTEDADEEEVEDPENDWIQKLISFVWSSLVRRDIVKIQLWKLYLYFKKRVKN